MDKPTLADRIITPILWLQEARGWRRRGLLLLYLGVATVAGALGWRWLCLLPLPDGPEPFDLARYGRVEVPDSDNALVACRAAFARFGDLPTRDYKVANADAWDVHDWAAAEPEVRRWADDHRAALDAWLPATDRPDSLLVQPEALRMRTDLDPVQRIRPYARLALLEGSRLERSGDLAGAWRMYRAALRASRHASRHGGSIQRLIGFSILKNSRARVAGWMTAPAVTPDLLRRAIGDVEACRAMTGPVSEMVRAEYFSARAEVADMDGWRKLGETGPYSDVHWYNQFAAGRWAHRFVRREPERSARVLRLLFAGYLAQCDRPAPARPALLVPWLMIYAHDARTPRAVRSITPEALEGWAKASIVLEYGPFSPQIQGLLDTEPGLLDGLALGMAERAFALERGRPPATYGELVGPYLKAPPAGVAPGDPIGAR